VNTPSYTHTCTSCVDAHIVTWIYVSHEAQKWHLSDLPFFFNVSHMWVWVWVWVWVGVGGGGDVGMGVGVQSLKLCTFSERGIHQRRNNI